MLPSVSVCTSHSLTVETGPKPVNPTNGEYTIKQMFLSVIQVHMDICTYVCICLYMCESANDVQCL